MRENLRYTETNRTNAIGSKFNKESDTILFGIYKDAAHLEWIQKNGKYNVRLGKRNGSVSKSGMVISASRLFIISIFPTV